MKWRIKDLFVEVSDNEQAVNDIKELIELLTDKRTFEMYQITYGYSYLRDNIHALLEDTFDLNTNPPDWPNSVVTSFLTNLSSDVDPSYVEVTYNQVFKDELKSLRIAHAIAYHDGSYYTSFRKMIIDVFDAIRRVVDAGLSLRRLTMALTASVSGVEGYDDALRYLVRRMYDGIESGSNDNLQAYLNSEYEHGLYVSRADEMLSVYERMIRAIDDLITKDVAADEIVPEAPSDAPLEKFAFQSSRKERLPREKDTEIERDLYKALYYHLRSNTPLKSQHVDLIKSFLERGEYTKMFHGPDTDVIYRGMVVTQNYLLKALKIRDKTQAPSEEGEMDASFTFTPKKGVYATSWTSDLEAARKFWVDNPGVKRSNDYWGIIMYARVSDAPGTLVACDDGLYDLDSFEHHSDEHEVIAFGKIRVYKIMWTHFV